MKAMPYSVSNVLYDGRPGRSSYRAFDTVSSNSWTHCAMTVTPASSTLMACDFALSFAHSFFSVYDTVSNKTISRLLLLHLHANFALIVACFTVSSPRSSHRRRGSPFAVRRRLLLRQVLDIDDDYFLFFFFYFFVS